MNDSMLTITYSGHHDSFNYKRKLSWHAHSCPEIIYVIQGENMTHFENGEVFYCQPGSLLITPPNLRHKQIDLPNCELYYIGFETSDNDFNLSLRQLNLSKDPYIAIWMEQIYQLYHLQEAFAEATMLLQVLLHRLKTLDKENNIAETYHYAVSKALKFINQIIVRGDNASMQEIAKFAGVSVSHLNTLFKKEFQLSVMQIVAQKRMSRARTLLADFQLSISDIAELCGFTDVNYFIRIFRKYHRISPNNFRKDFQHNKSNYHWQR